MLNRSSLRAGTIRAMVLVLIPSIAVTPPAAIAATEDKPVAVQDKKQLESRAKELVAEGKVLEQQGKLLDANNKFIDAEGVYSTSDARDGIKRIRDAIKQDLQSAVTASHRSFDAGKVQESIEQLQHALAEDPDNAAVLFDLAMCYAKLGDRNDMVARLDLAAAHLGREKDSEDLMELRSATLMGLATPAASDANKPLAGFNSAYLESDRTPGDPDQPAPQKTAAARSLCDQIADLHKNFPANAAATYNAAKCAEEDARQSDAARLLAEYAKTAPDALDRGDALLIRTDLSSVAGLPGDSGAAVRQHFATAARYLDYRRYDRALGEYQAAAKSLPDFPLTEWRLAILYEAFGDVNHTREHFTRYLEIATDPEQRSDAQVHLDSLMTRRADYDAMVEDARDILSDLLARSIGLDLEGVKHKAHLSSQQRNKANKKYKEFANASEKLATPYVVRQLDRTRQVLELATAIFPLGVEANELLALIDLEGNNWPAALRSYDAIAAQGFPVSFYAQETTSSDSKIVHAVKAEVDRESIRLVYLSTYHNDKKIAEAPDNSAGNDDLGNLVVSAAQPPDPQADSITLKISDLEAVSTDRNLVVLKLKKEKKEQIYLEPVYMVAAPPFQGPAARALGNEYTRLFIRYMGFEDAKLGKEGMTSGEKFQLGVDIAFIAVSIAGTVETAGLGGASAYSNAVQIAQLIHTLEIVRTASIVMDAAGIATHGASLAQSLTIDTRTLERTSNDQRRAIEGIQFKIIPSRPAQMTFRDKF